MSYKTQTLLELKTSVDFKRRFFAGGSLNAFLAQRRFIPIVFLTPAAEADDATGNTKAAYTSEYKAASTWTRERSLHIQ
ncbi:hypothetical protein AVEN_28868-1, partial [Araneus ventricosus]